LAYETSVNVTAPALVSPADKAAGVSLNPVLTWSPPHGAESYEVQISASSNFSTIVRNMIGLDSASYAVNGLSGLSTYYWRVCAANSTTTSGWSPAWSFTTLLSLPEKVTLMGPPEDCTIGMDSVTLVWHRSSPNVAMYEVEIIGDSTSSYLVKDTTFTCKFPAPRIGNAILWRVRAQNPTGYGEYSESWALRRVAVTGVRTESAPYEFVVFNNFPNPFNPSTSISFTIPSRSFVSLKVFDGLGREVALLIAEELAAGNYSHQWDAGGLPSGMYFYRLQAGTNIAVKNMILIK
jgi:hypothetical protein